MSTTYEITATVMTSSRPEVIWTGEGFKEMNWEPESFNSEADARAAFDAMDADSLRRDGFAFDAVIRITRSDDDMIDVIAEKRVEVL